MRFVSFSLWGDTPMYCVGAIRNAELMPKIYPGWKMVLYQGPGVPAEIITKLLALDVDVRPGVFKNGLFDRFLANDDPDMEAFISRDCDSRLNQREKNAVETWLASKFIAHSICDHPHHTNPFMGGLWGMKKGGVKNIRKLIEGWKAAHQEGTRDSLYDTDQRFLAAEVYPLVKHTTLRHDLCYANRFFGSFAFPSRFGEDSFCGEVMDQNDQPRVFNRWQRIPYQSI